MDAKVADAPPHTKGSRRLAIDVLLWLVSLILVVGRGGCLSLSPWLVL
jgi:hypothetical protein